MPLRDYANPTVCSLITTAKLNEVEPFAYPRIENPPARTGGFLTRVDAAPRLDDRFHETGIDETGSMELEGCWWIPRLRLAERGAVSWQDGVKRSRGR